MSVATVERFTQALPWRLAQDVVGYARSVDAAFDDIAADAGVAAEPELREAVVFIAGVRKLHGLLSGGFWTLENCLELLQRGGGPATIRVGGLRIWRGSTEYRLLKGLLESLQDYLSTQGLLEVVQLRTYAEILVALRNEHP